MHGTPLPARALPLRNSAALEGGIWGGSCRSRATALEPVAGSESMGVCRGTVSLAVSSALRPAVKFDSLAAKPSVQLSGNRYCSLAALVFPQSWPPDLMTRLDRMVPLWGTPRILTAHAPTVAKTSSFLALPDFWGHLASKSGQKHHTLCTEHVSVPQERAQSCQPDLVAGVDRRTLPPGRRSIPPQVPPLPGHPSPDSG